MKLGLNRMMLSITRDDLKIKGRTDRRVAQNAKGRTSASAARSEYEAVLKNDTDETRKAANIILAEQIQKIPIFPMSRLPRSRGRSKFHRCRIP